MRKRMQGAMPYVSGDLPKNLTLTEIKARISHLGVRIDRAKRRQEAMEDFGALLLSPYHHGPR